MKRALDPLVIIMLMLDFLLKETCDKTNGWCLNLRIYHGRYFFAALPMTFANNENESLFFPECLTAELDWTQQELAFEVEKKNSVHTNTITSRKKPGTWPQELHIQCCFITATRDVVCDTLNVKSNLLSPLQSHHNTRECTPSIFYGWLLAALRNEGCVVRAL